MPLEILYRKFRGHHAPIHYPLTLEEPVDTSHRALVGPRHRIVCRHDVVWFGVGTYGGTSDPYLKPAREDGE